MFVPVQPPAPEKGEFVSREWLVAKGLSDPSCGSLVPLLSETQQLFSVIWNHDRRIYLIIHLLLVWTRRYGGHLGGHEQKTFSLLGTKVYFHVNSSRKKSIVLTPNMAALSHGCKPRIALLVVLRTSRCHTHEMGKFHGVADRVQSPNHVMQQVEKTKNNKSTTEQKRTNNGFRNTKKHPEMVIYFYSRVNSKVMERLTPTQHFPLFDSNLRKQPTFRDLACVQTPSPQ